MPEIRANGLDIGYDVVGAGPPAVVLHGATSIGREDFAAQLPLMSRAFLVHLPDARGHGRTRWDAAAGFHYEWLVDDVLAFVDALGLRTFHLVGFSMGGMTALQLASRHPERVRTLVVVGITTQREPRASVLRRLMDPARILAADPAWAAELSRRHDDGQGPGAWQRLLPAIAADVAGQPLLGPGELRRIDAPTMVVCGDHDPFVPVDHAWGIARQVRDGRLFVAPACGHEVMVRRPGLFNEAMAGFYRATEAIARQRADEGDATTVLTPAAAAPPGAAPHPAPSGPASTGPAMPAGPSAETYADLSHPAPEAVPGVEETDTHWLDTRRPEGGRP